MVRIRAICSSYSSLYGYVLRDSYVFSIRYGPLMISDQYDLFVKFLKLKTPVFKDTKSEDTHDFLVDYHELLHKIDIIK